MSHTSWLIIAGFDREHLFDFYYEKLWRVELFDKTAQVACFVPDKSALFKLGFFERNAWRHWNCREQ